MKVLKACLAEMFGTLTLVLISVGAIHNANHQQMDLLGIALAYGLTTAAMVSATVAVSGGHLNPAVSFGAFLAGRIGFVQTIRYILAQLAGAVLAGFICVTIFNTGIVSTATPNLGKDVSIGTAVLVEATLTFLLAFVMFGTIADGRAPRTGGLCVGLIVAAGVLFGQPLTGAAMNPARAFGTAVASSHFANHLVYWIGPMLGGALAGVIYGRFLILPDEPPIMPKKN